MEDSRDRYPKVLLLTGLSGTDYLKELSHQVEAAIKDFKINFSTSSLDVELDGIMKFHSIDKKCCEDSQKKSVSPPVIEQMQNSFIHCIKALICENGIPSIETLDKAVDKVYGEWKTMEEESDIDACKAMLDVHGMLWNRFCGFGVVRYLLVILARKMKATLPRLSSFDVIARCIRSPTDFPLEMWLSQLEILQTLCSSSDWSAIVRCLLESWIEACLLILILPGTLSNSQLRVITYFLANEEKSPPKSILICYVESMRLAVRSTPSAAIFQSISEWLLESQWSGFLLRLWYRLVLIRCAIDMDKGGNWDSILNSLYEETEHREAALSWTYQMLLNLGWTDDNKENKSF